MTTTPASDSSDVLGSLVLLAATALALVVANTALGPFYKLALAQPLSIGLGAFAIEDTIKDWIKNALMAVFFLYVGLEIKYEFAEGALSTRARAAMPFFAAAGGIIVPAIIYLLLAGRDPVLQRGWAIPSATDIAFAVGIVGLLGRHVPASLKAFLLAVAVIDDLAAILIIALFYTGGLSAWPLLVAALLVGALAVLNQRGEARIGVHLGIGVLLWLALKQGGINPTLGGVIVALFIPLRGRAKGDTPLHDLAHRLKGVVTFAIMPIFAFANSGVSFSGLGLDTLAGPVALGVMLGLAIGKPLGITFAVWLGIAIGRAALPAGASWRQIVGIAALAGIGFTMSLFIADLAFGDGALMEQARIGVLLGSSIATLAGTLLLYGARRPAQ